MVGLALLGLGLPFKCAYAGEVPLCERVMVAAAQDNNVPLKILYSVGLTETGHRGTLGPYDLNVDGRSIHSQNLPQALAAYAAADRSGAKFIDIGCMQIDHHFHAQQFRSLEDMFDPIQNVHYAARLLKTLYKQEGSWTMAVARYNAGPRNPTAQHKYVCAVISHMVASGLGGWTPNARHYCG